MLARSCIMLCC